MTDQSLRAKAEAATKSTEAYAEFWGAFQPEVALDLLDRLEAAEREAEAFRGKLAENIGKLMLAHRLLDEAGKALEPFAVHADAYDSPADGDDDTISGVAHTPHGRSKLRVGHCRTARAVQASIRAATEPMEM